MTRVGTVITTVRVVITKDITVPSSARQQSTLPVQPMTGKRLSEVAWQSATGKAPGGDGWSLKDEAAAPGGLAGCCHAHQDSGKLGSLAGGPERGHYLLDAEGGSASQRAGAA